MASGEGRSHQKAPMGQVWRFPSFTALRFRSWGCPATSVLVRGRPSLGLMRTTSGFQARSCSAFTSRTLPSSEATLIPPAVRIRASPHQALPLVCRKSPSR